MFKYKRMFLNGEVLASLITTGESWRVTMGIPKGAQVVGAGFDKHRGCFMFLLEHGEFEPTPEGSLCPELDQPTVRVYDPLAEAGQGVAWLIEYRTEGAPVWYCGDVRQWSPNAHEAVRFTRSTDARMIAQHLPTYKTGHVSVTEHIFS